VSLPIIARRVGEGLGDVDPEGGDEPRAQSVLVSAAVDSDAALKAETAPMAIAIAPKIRTTSLAAFTARLRSRGVERFL
jgi:hypothetical protein